MLLLGSCVTLPSEVNLEEENLILVKTVRLPDNQPWYSLFADHSWIEVKKNGKWFRLEILTENSGVVISEINQEMASANTRWSRNVHVVSVSKDKKPASLAAQLLKVAPNYPYNKSYQAWPGPNSNTFVEWCCYEIDGLNADLYSNALGKDYADWFRAGLSNSSTGIELKTMLLGGQIGLHEGVDINFLGLVIGVGTWPPRLKVPFFPDRLF